MRRARWWLWLRWCRLLGRCPHNCRTYHFGEVMTDVTHCTCGDCGALLADWRRA